MVEQVAVVHMSRGGLGHFGVRETISLYNEKFQIQPIIN